AGTRGYLDGVPVVNVSAYESELLSELRSAGASILASIKEKKALNDDIEAQISTFLDGFTKGYVARLAA
ncbi:MAG TPA: F0F1 ATP synthase subunit alpha, partial [Alphaproteobacteria bacterium]|nr:F0F1 ATP synthase subunit alpha [Alphaproteobacteria bacterium]